MALDGKNCHREYNMDDKEKAKTLLQYGGKIIDVESLPLGVVIEAISNHVSKPPTFEERYMLDRDDYIEFDIRIKVRGKINDVGYIHSMKKCAIIPYPEG